MLRVYSGGYELASFGRLWIRFFARRSGASFDGHWLTRIASYYHTDVAMLHLSGASVEGENVIWVSKTRHRGKAP